MKANTQSRQSLDLRSLPTECEIDEAYDLAYRIIQQMRVISCYRVSWSSMCSIGYAAEEGPQKAIDHWHKFKDDKADALESLLLQLEADTKQLQDHFSPLWRLYQVYAYDDLGDFVSNGRKWGRCAYPAIEFLSMEVNAWGLQCRSLYGVSWLQPCDSELRHVCEQSEAGFPMSFETESDLRERLYREQGKLIKGLLEAQALYSKQEVSNTTLAGSLEVETIKQEALLASLSTKQRSYVFCGRIWTKYRQEQNALILEGKRNTKQRVRIVESFPIATAEGWPKEQLDEFINYAKEGIKDEKPWTDFVKGSKGEKIPLKKFLA